jgi:putative two-component system response regulator
MKPEPAVRSEPTSPRFHSELLGLNHEEAWLGARVSARADRSAGTVLVVDDVPANAQLLERLLTREGYLVHTARDGETALADVARMSPDLVLLDVVLPGLDGFEVCRRLKADPATHLIPVVLVTSLDERENRLRGIRAGANDFLTKPIDVQEVRARTQSLVRLKRCTDDLESAESLILDLALTIEARGAYTEGHCSRLARYATALGQQLHLGPDDLNALHRGGFLHDIGEVGIPDAILLKPAALTHAEYEIVKGHTVIGDAFCRELRSLRAVRPIVRHHHERLNGTGYPDGLRGDAIPLLAQIIAVVDVYDALTTVRPYKSALPAERAYQQLLVEVEHGWWRRDLVEEWIALAESRRLTSMPEGADRSSLPVEPGAQVSPSGDHGLPCQRIGD